MKQTLAFALSGILGAAAATSIAGTVAPEIVSPALETTNGLEDAIRPMTNPTLFDLAVPTTNIHAIAMYHKLPNYVNTTIGGVPMGGHVEVYALQAELAFNERFSLVATKDGYVRVRPDTQPLWSQESGFANIAAGAKYAFIYDPENAFALSGTATFEVPTGNHDVFQGEGDGAINLILSTVKVWDKFQVAAGAGAHLEFSDQLSDSSFVSVHASYEVTPWFIPLVELNWFHVLSTGDGRFNYFDQAGGAVPAVATFEGNDLLNFGASNASQNRDLVTAAIGFRSHLCKDVDLGLAYELPLTDANDGIIEDRWTLDLVWKF
ncbi:transporter [Haloferula chungangensis]|uniref:Transporter n=1 Tax=Haloferula chungangensis TaxID=1048331 RepID=A0ABW2L9G4_9BACT